MKRILGLFGILIVSSLVLAYPLGVIMSAQFPSGVSDLILPKEFLDFFDGIFWSYLILTPLLFGIWGIGRRWLQIVVVSFPVLAFCIFVGSGYLGWSLIFFISSIILTLIINIFRSKKLQ